MQGNLVKCQEGCESLQLWFKNLENSAIAIAFLNLKDTDVEYPFCVNVQDVTKEIMNSNIQVTFSLLV